MDAYYIYVYGVMGFVQLFIIYLTINIKNIHDKFIKWEDKVKTNDSLKQKKTFSTSKQTRNDNCFNSPLGLKHFFSFSNQSLLNQLWYYRKYNLSTPRTLQWKKTPTTVSLPTIGPWIPSLSDNYHSQENRTQVASYGSRFFSTYMYLVHRTCMWVEIYQVFQCIALNWRIIFLQNSWSLLIFNFHSD